MQDITLEVSQAIELLNQTLSQAFPFIIVEGEVASFKVNQNKFVFFDLKDESGSLGCFMMVFQLKFPLQDGMKIKVVAEPKLTPWGKFSLTVREVIPVGEGSLKKAFEMLKAKLEREGLFDAERKRPLPEFPARVGVISSVQAAGYRDFIKIAGNRWPLSKIEVLSVPVQGIEAPEKIIEALRRFNQQTKLVDILAVIRGGGSADDLAAFNHEGLVRELAASRIPTVVGVGHEIDVTLADLAADRRAATPSNAAEIIFPDKKHLIHDIQSQSAALTNLINLYFDSRQQQIVDKTETIERQLGDFLETKTQQIIGYQRLIEQMNPSTVLRRGYSLTMLRGKALSDAEQVSIGDEIVTRLHKGNIISEVRNVQSKNI